jgi:hypothetical protein
MSISSGHTSRIFGGQTSGHFPHPSYFLQRSSPVNPILPDRLSLFNQYHELLTEKATQYFDSLLDEY